MIQVKPMEDRQEEEKRLRDAGLPAGENRVLLMKDRGEPVGCAIVGLEGDALHLRKLSVKGYNFLEKPQGDTAFYLDTLMRSAASWGEDHGAVQIVTDFPDFYGFLKARGFETDEARAFTPMSTIVRYEWGGQPLK